MNILKDLSVQIIVQCVSKDDERIEYQLCKKISQVNGVFHEKEIPEHLVLDIAGKATNELARLLFEAKEAHDLLYRRARE